MNDKIEECRTSCGGTIDIARVLNGLHRLYGVKDAREFPAVMMGVAEDILPCLTSSVDTVDLSTGRATNLFSHPTPLSHEEFMNRWNVFCHEHPGIDYLKNGGQASVMAITDFVSQRQFRKTAIYNELFKVCGGGYQLGVILPVPGFVAGMAINRDT
ncbi:MAG TPA: hypothetical protein VGP12_00365, partial [Nitrosospira sp.]|nr:hypothetical protein [Nitrosospira sp.]